MNVDVNVIFSRHMLAGAHKIVRKNFPDTRVRDDAWVYNLGRGHWEFHGPEKFYWHGRAGNAYDARYHGWMAWLEHKGVQL